MPPKISVCIPAFNRADRLPQLLDSILGQDFPLFEIVIAEDNSPERGLIRAIVEKYKLQNRDKLKYSENPVNLGYDGNIRNLLSLASGDYCLFMGNDDVMAPNALAAIASLLNRYDNVGVILRSYAHFQGEIANVTQEFRYFPEEKFFPAGVQAVTTFFRRCVVISGLVLHRGESVKHNTAEFDGTLLYQLHLVGHIMMNMNGVFTPEIIAYYREGGVPDFGYSEKERGIFTPREQTPESSLEFVRGMIKIANSFNPEDSRIRKRIMKDMGNYIYPVLSIQAKRTKRVFISYVYSLWKMGFWQNPIFYLYFIFLMLFGRENCDKGICFIKNRLGYTPRLGRVYGGRNT